MQIEELTWKDVVTDALRRLGGQAHLSEINERIKGHPKTEKNPTWRDTIRRVMRQYKVFQPVPPERSGIYKLVEVESLQLETQNLSSKDAEVDHGVAQGMLITLGNIYGYETFVPIHYQSVRKFRGKRLGDLVTVENCTGVIHGPNVSKVKEIDVLWLDEDDEGLFPVYAFEVEHTTRIRNGLDRLLKIPRRFHAQGHFFIIGPTEKERTLFDRFVNQEPLRKHRDKFTFRLYDQLQDVYDAAIKHDIEHESFGLLERYKRI